MLAPARPHSTESKFRLLYLGADLEFVAALRKALTEPDYRLITCSDRGDAILFLESEIPYQLLLIDLEWRGREGLKLARLARSLPFRKRMPIILVAATELSSDMKTLGRKAGVTRQVTKTPDVDAVSEAIRQALEG